MIDKLQIERLKRENRKLALSISSQTLRAAELERDLAALSALEKTKSEVELQDEIAQLHAAIATPEAYAALVSEIVEKDFAEQVKQLRATIRTLIDDNDRHAKEIERLKACAGKETP